MRLGVVAQLPPVRSPSHACTCRLTRACAFAAAVCASGSVTVLAGTSSGKVGPFITDVVQVCAGSSRALQQMKSVSQHNVW
jgi:hypothetical protein